MEIYVQDMPWHHKLIYKISSVSIYPTILSSIGFAYIAIPSHLQTTIRHTVPLTIREKLLSFLTTDGWLIVLLICTIIFAIWGTIGGQLVAKLVKTKHKSIIKENDQLKQERDNKSIDTYQLFSNYLYRYYQDFELGTNERVSLYKLDMEMFTCIGRYSDNEIFRLQSTRLYPKNQGCISKVWETGKYQYANVPDPEDNINDWNQYNIEHFGFTLEDLDRIRMKSRSFFGLRLKNTENIIVAVILFESLNKSGLHFGRLNRYFTELEQKNIVHLIESLDKHIPSLEEAREEGF